MSAVTNEQLCAEIVELKRQREEIRETAGYNSRNKLRWRGKRLRGWLKARRNKDGCPTPQAL